MCIDYQKLNNATRKDHFPLSFIDQILESLARHTHFCYFDEYSEFHRIPIHLSEQEKKMFTCPSSTFSYMRMLFGLCNAPTIFQRCMTAIFLILLKISWRFLWMIFQSMVLVLMTACLIFVIFYSDVRSTYCFEWGKSDISWYKKALCLGT